MKHFSSRVSLLLLLTCLLASPIYLSAQQKKSSSASSKKWAKNTLDLYQIHNLSMWGGLGYSGLVHKQYDGSILNQPNIVSAQSQFRGGAGGILGIGYEWHYKKFMLSIGPEFRIFSSQDKLKWSLNPDLQPYEGPLAIAGSNPASAHVLPGQTKYYDPMPFSENQAIGQIMLPIMAGAQFNDLSVPLYFLAGVKVGYTLFDSFTQKGSLHSWIHDDQAYDPRWEDIRDLGTDKYKSKGKNKLGLDVALSAEVGVNLDSYLSAEWNDMNDSRQYPWHMRVALFLDYGLPIMSMTPSGQSMFSVDEASIASTSLHTSELVKVDTKLNSLLVGAKFTALLQLNRPKQMKPKNPYMVIHLINGRTGKPETAEVAITRLDNNRVQKKNVNSRGFIVQRFTPAEYRIEVSKPGYLPVDAQSALLLADQKNDLKQKLDTNTFVLWPIPMFSCTVRDSKTNALIPATISLVENHEDDSKTIAELQQDLAKGSVSYQLPMGQDYSALVVAENYQQQIYHIGVQDLQDIHMNLTLDPIEKGRTYVIENLFFASDQTQILPQSEPALQELFEFLNDNPDVRIRITGHTDWVGSDRDNQILSEGRSKSVKQSMVERGIDPSRMETEGKGESQPVDTNETEEGRQNNRRVEFTIL